jgi:endonuclease YncB( thermonuclease family)
MVRVIVLIFSLLALLVGCSGGAQPLQLVTPTGEPIDTVTVTRVIDGDTFVASNGWTIRVLGIDSCELKTKGGKAAKADAQNLLQGRVVLSSQAGKDLDPYERHLRYVRLVDHRDFGSVMVSRSHTEVYKGKNDASASYVSNLRGLDQNGRSCR